MTRRIVILAVPLVTALVVATSLWQSWAQEPAARKRKVQKTDAEWRKLLTPAQYAVTRLKDTEPAGTGKYANSHAKGIYTCVCCGAELFNSQTKFESGTGWPSFYKPIAAKSIDRAPDYHTGDLRVEAMCNDCGAHLGHVFDDGPPPTGLRYCINSASLKLVSAAGTTTSKKTAKSAKLAAKTRAKAKDTGATAETAADESKSTDPAKKPAEETESKADSKP